MKDLVCAIAIVGLIIAIIWVVLAQCRSPFTLSYHALVRMKERGISKAEVARAMKGKDRRERTRNDCEKRCSDGVCVVVGKDKTVVTTYADT